MRPLFERENPHAYNSYLGNQHNSVINQAYHYGNRFLAAVYSYGILPEIYY
jgi:hypothetical protein